jgi:FixJ family two-component response regulator
MSILAIASREAEFVRDVVGGFLNKQTSAELRAAENTL